MKELINWIPSIIAIVIAVAGALVTWGKVKTLVDGNKQDITDLRGMFFSKDGSSNYVTKLEWIRAMESHRKSVGEQIAEVKEMINAGDTKRELAKDAIAKELRLIAGFMGEVRASLPDNRKAS